MAPPYHSDRGRDNDVPDEYWTESSDRQLALAGVAADDASDKSSDESSEIIVNRWTAGSRNTAVREAGRSLAHGLQGPAVPALSSPVNNLRNTLGLRGGSSADSPTLLSSLWQTEDSGQLQSGGNTAIRGDAFVGFTGAGDSATYNAMPSNGVRGSNVAGQQLDSQRALHSQLRQHLSAPMNRVNADSQENVDTEEQSGDLLADLLESLAIEPPRVVNDPPVLRASTPPGWYSSDASVEDVPSDIDIDTMPGVESILDRPAFVTLDREISACLSNETEYQSCDNSFASSSRSPANGAVAGTQMASADDARIVELQERISALEAELLVRDSEIAEADSGMKHLEGFLQCAICMETFTRPHTLACGHVFCQECLASWLGQHKSCPTCRATVGDRPAAAFVVQDIMGALNIGNNADMADTTHASDNLASDPWSDIFPRELSSYLGKFIRCGGCTSWILENGICHYCSARELQASSLLSTNLTSSRRGLGTLGTRAHGRARNRNNRSDAVDIPSAQDLANRTMRLREMVDRLRSSYTNRQNGSGRTNEAEQGIHPSQTTRTGARTLRRRQMSLSVSPPESLFDSIDLPSLSQARSPPVRWVDPNEIAQPGPTLRRHVADQAAARSPTSYQWHNPFASRTVNRNRGHRVRESNRPPHPATTATANATNATNAIHATNSPGISDGADAAPRQPGISRRLRFVGTTSVPISVLGSATRNPGRIGHIFGTNRNNTASRNAITEQRSQILPTVSSLPLQMAGSNARGSPSRRSPHVPLTQILATSHGAVGSAESTDSLIVDESGLDEDTIASHQTLDAARHRSWSTDDMHQRQSQLGHSLVAEQPATSTSGEAATSALDADLSFERLLELPLPTIVDNMDYNYLYTQIQALRNRLGESRRGTDDILRAREQILRAHERMQRQFAQAHERLTRSPGELTITLRNVEADISESRAPGEWPRHLRRQSTLDHESA